MGLISIRIRFCGCFFADTCQYSLIGFFVYTTYIHMVHPIFFGLKKFIECCLWYKRATAGQNEIILTIPKVGCFQK
ncbi:unnamed protein product, partial [Vitis vinifera]